MRLFGTEHWSPQNLDAEIAFELAFARQAPSLLELVATADRNDEPAEPRQRISESIFAMSRAAELAFASGNTDTGYAICLRMITETRPASPMQLALYAAVGTLTGTVEVRLEAKGVKIDGPSEKPVFLRWPDDSAFATVLSRHFFVAAAASGTMFKEPSDFFNSEERSMKPQAFAALVASPEFGAIIDRGHEAGQPSRAWLQAIEALEYNYLMRLKLMQQDTYHWETMQPRGSIIDWSLLCIWTAHVRSGEFAARLSGGVPQNAAALFIRDLADELWLKRKAAPSFKI
jgi:hypothetical protein